MKKYFERFITSVKKSTDSTRVRDQFIISELRKLAPGATLLDAGCGAQPYRKYCKHLNYKAQDFGKYSVDEKPSYGAMRSNDYQYGDLDYICDIINIPEDSGHFDAILCSEVLEHLPAPLDAVREFSRLLKPQGTLIMTFPGICMRHMDPYFYSAGLSDRWVEFALGNNFEYRVEANGGYYKFMAGETLRSMSQSGFFGRLVLFPSLIYFFQKKENDYSSNTLTNQYLVVARKKRP